MIYKEKFKIGLKDALKDGTVRNIAILEYLENIGSYHSDSIGYGINSSINTHLNWLLLDWKVQIIKRPKYGEELSINTWCRKIVKCYAYRDFEIYDESNNLCVIATSKWVLVNTKEKKIVKIEKEMEEKYDSELDKNVFKDSIIEKLKEPEEYESKIIYEVKRKDIDVIGHMHNIYYLDLAYEALPEKIYKKNIFDYIRIMFKKEIKYGEKVLCKYTQKEGKHIVTLKDEDDKILHAIIELK